MKSIFLSLAIIVFMASTVSAAKNYEYDCEKNYHGFIVQLELEEPEGAILAECMIWSKKHQAWIGHEMNSKGDVLYRELSPKEAGIFQKDKEKLENLIMQEEADKKNSDRYNPVLEVQRGRLR